MAASSDLEANTPLLDSAAAEEDESCTTGAWARPPVALRSRRNGDASATATAEGAESREVPDSKSVAASLVTLLLSLPALVGSWCWPLLLAGFMGISATAGAKAISHTFSLALTLTILTNLAQYFAWKGTTKGGTHWQRFGPAYMLAVAAPLLCADLVRHTLQDAEIWDGPSSHMYRPGCGPVRGLHGILCLSVTGWLFTIVFTYSGFLLMIAAVFMSSNLHVTLRQAWAQIRRGRTWWWTRRG